jgi:predicted nucleic acid-binding protein
MSEFPCECIILDACCVINLYASGYMRNILASIPKQVAVAAYVLDEESNKIYAGPLDDPTRETELINLQPFIDDNLIHVVSLECEAEENRVVNFSSVRRLGTGEAITAAIAIQRQWSLATDDRSARSFFMRSEPALHLISTLDLLKCWVDTTRPQPAAVSTVLENIQIRARYKPHNTHHLYGWWECHKSESITFEL